MAKAGKAVLNLPMFVNAFLVIPGLFPGQFPSGGPVHRLLDVYHAAAPSLDALSPNAYAPDFKNTCALYTRAGNPSDCQNGPLAGNLFWAVGHHAALAWSPFGALEKLEPKSQIGDSYRLLSDLMPQLTQWQSEGKVDAILVENGEDSRPISLGGYKISLTKAARPTPAPSPAQPSSSDTRPFAIVVNTAPNEFLFIGANGVPQVNADSGGPAHTAIASKDEVSYRDGKWVTGRRLNGDEVGDGLPHAGIGMLKIKVLHFD